MMKNKFLYFVLLALSTLQTACTEDFFNPIVDIPVKPFDPKIAITGSFDSQDSVLTVYAVKTKSVLGRAGKIDDDSLNNPVIQLFRDNVLIATLNKKAAKLFETKIKIPAGDPAEYRLTVSATGLPTAEVTQKMPTAPVLDSVSYRPLGAIKQDDNPFGGSSEKVDEYNFYIKDSLNTSDFYTASLRTYDSRITGTRNAYLYSLDPLTESEILADKSFNGNAYRFRMYGYPQTYPSQTFLSFELHNLTKDAYDFKKSYDVYDNIRDNFLSEPTTLFSNVKNGYGVFLMQSTTKKVIKVM
jgi:hypothetical protein